MLSRWRLSFLNPWHSTQPSKCSPQSCPLRFLYPPCQPLKPWPWASIISWCWHHPVATRPPHPSSRHANPARKLHQVPTVQWPSFFWKHPESLNLSSHPTYCHGLHLCHSSERRFPWGSQGSMPFYVPPSRKPPCNYSNSLSSRGGEDVKLLNQKKNSNVEGDLGSFSQLGLSHSSQSLLHLSRETLCHPFTSLECYKGTTSWKFALNWRRSWCLGMQTPQKVYETCCESPKGFLHVLLKLAFP